MRDRSEWAVKSLKTLGKTAKKEDSKYGFGKAVVRENGYGDVLDRQTKEAESLALQSEFCLENHEDAPDFVRHGNYHAYRLRRRIYAFRPFPLKSVHANLGLGFSRRHCINSVGLFVNLGAFQNSQEVRTTCLSQDSPKGQSFDSDLEFRAQTPNRLQTE